MPTVQLFVTCLVDSFYPETAEAVVSILRRLGISVDFPKAQTCCGQPQFNAGLRVNCDGCGEEIMNEREVRRGGLALCRVCAGDSYYEMRIQFEAARVNSNTTALGSK